MGLLSLGLESPGQELLAGQHHYALVFKLKRPNLESEDWVRADGCGIYTNLVSALTLTQIIAQ